MNELMNLGPNTAHMNQKPQNPFSPDDRVIKSGDEDASVAVVVEVPPPEKDVGVYGQSMDGEAVCVASPSSCGVVNGRLIRAAVFGGGSGVRQLNFRAIRVRHHPPRRW
jgi:hypothetical protein